MLKAKAGVMVKSRVPGFVATTAQKLSQEAPELEPHNRLHNQPCTVRANGGISNRLTLAHRKKTAQIKKKLFFIQPGFLTG
jgi:hypothetical protein